MTTDTELCDVLRGWVKTNFPTTPEPTPIPPEPTLSAKFFNGHIQAPGRFGNLAKSPNSYGLQHDMVRMLAIWSVPGIGGNTFVDWANIHTGPGQFNWAGFDGYVTAMKNWGVKGMLVPLHSPPAWLEALILRHRQQKNSSRQSVNVYRVLSQQ